MKWKSMIQRRQWSKCGIKIPKGSTIDAPTEIGKGTRINGEILIKGKGNCVIGKYCAIGAGVRIITSNHLIGQANLQCHLQRKIGARQIDVPKGAVMIGHNVWIGDSVLILSGVKIGDGAVIGAGAVVTRDIPDFAVAVGVPCKPVRTRFAPSICKQLKELAWWDWSDERMKRNKQFFSMDLAEAEEHMILSSEIVD